MKKVYEEKLNRRSPLPTAIATNTTTDSVPEAISFVHDLLDGESDIDV
jgi:hypothetical protein